MALGTDAYAGLRDTIRKRYQSTATRPPAPSIAGVSGLQPFQTATAARPPAPPTPAVTPPTVPTAAAPAPVALPQRPAYYTPPDWGFLNQSGGNAPRDINFGAGFGGTLNDILRNFLGSGAFSDQPNQALIDAVRSNAIQDAQARRDRASLQAQAMGLDPATAAALGLQTDLAASGDVANASNNAVLGELQNKQDFGQKLLELLLGNQGTQNAYNPVNGPQWIGALSGLVSASRRH